MKVLVVDDDPGSLMVAKAVVEQAGYECLSAADGDAAWELFQLHQPQVVVTDWVMPGMNGLELCEAIRRVADDSYTYLVLLTSFGSQDDVLAGMEAGADDYVTKPLDPFTLRTRLLVALRVTALHSQLGKYRQELTRQARTDPLTNVDNRLKLTEDLELLHGRSQRYGNRYSLALCDVDHFKSFNDLQGHPAGDEALKAVARSLTLLSRDTDGVYRYGGEEFLLILPDQGAADAEAAVERIRSGIEALAITHYGNPRQVLTISAGISTFTADHPVSSGQLLKEADDALYAAKAAGRNRVSSFVRAG
ncbi:MULTISPECIES: diguanylate cyclase [unclassified Arthrobacter]|uniref:GGDEF domain-containing response regulator n=1 Tax=unclassified Arthrobacter TaxID=235627 RepID=UPI00149116C1|nr:diguanylate cyclase [Arthrobacter sp. AET 35A]MBE0009113.1 diguanylate cyclase [Arthrobacter sp. AET 35A]NOJ63078.1 diguanylate cyclase [Arthrobacter sp. 147(2020)]